MTNVVPWFDITARRNFEQLLTTPPSNVLQLGCFAGDATAWLLARFPSAAICDIDTFSGSDEHEGYDMAQVEALYRARFAEEYRVETLVGRTVELLPKMVGRWFDFIYIDADHHAASVLIDALLSWPLLAPGGLMAFDDFTWGRGLETMQRPERGISAFMDLYAAQFRLVAMNTQVWLRKDDEESRLAI